MLENKSVPDKPSTQNDSTGAPFDSGNSVGENPVTKESTDGPAAATVTANAKHPATVDDGELPTSATANVEEIAETVPPESVTAQETVSPEPKPAIPRPLDAVYEHPLPVRVCHWLNSISLVVMAMSGLQVFMAFPSFGPKIPQQNLIHKMPSGLMLGGWLGGALPWHFTFAWIYVVTGLIYVGYQAISGNFRQMLFVPRDIPGVWPMVRHYFLFGPKPVPTEAYNPLQKIAYTSAIFIGAFSLITGMVLFNPVQFSLLTTLMGGFHRARIWHFASLCMLAFFIFGHLMMVAIHGLNNFLSMLTGWKKDPEYRPAPTAIVHAGGANKNV
jgi:thiosulfate reductase cytochrome b subunit